MAEAKSYDKAYKEQAVKLAKEIGSKKASNELGVPYGTLYGWIKTATSCCDWSPPIGWRCSTSGRTRR